MLLLRLHLTLALGLLATGARADQPELFSINNLLSASTAPGTSGENALGRNGANSATFTSTGGYVARRLHITGQLTRLTPNSPSSDALLQITPPNGRDSFIVRPFPSEAFGAGNLATLVSFNVNVPAGGFDPTGTWTIRAAEANQQGTLFAPDARWDFLSIGLEDVATDAPTNAADLGSITTSATLTRSLAPGEVLWVRAALPGATWSNHGYIDIDTEGSGLSAVHLALFNVAGLALAQDFGDGSASQSQLSFGPLGGARTPVGDGLAYDGRDGTLEAGIYWLALCAGPAQIVGEPWGIIASPGAPSGTARVNIRTGSRPTSAAPAINYDAGVLVGNSIAPPTAQPAMVIAGRAPVWVRFTTETDARHPKATFLDIDCEQTALAPTNDPVMGLWSERGQLVAWDSNDGSGSLCLLSFGQAAPTRARVGTGELRLGQDGPLHAGTYYLGIAPAPLSPGVLSDFVFAATSANSGSVRVNFKSNLTRASRACNSADIVGLGGISTPDGQNTSDDLIAFLASFFGGILSVADIATLGGGAGPDGQISTDDLIFFLSAYFAPCN